MVACSADPRLDTPAPLVDADAWVEALGEDPLGDHRLTDRACEPGGVIQEGVTLEVDTGLCPYAFLEQPLLADVQEGDPLEIVFWHGDLAAEVPGEAHIALLLDGTVAWERTLPIPSPACAYGDVIWAPRGSLTGSPIQLHLHNHGANTWNLLRVERVTLDTPADWSPGCDEAR